MKQRCRFDLNWLHLALGSGSSFFRLGAVRMLSDYMRLGCKLLGWTGSWFLELGWMVRGFGFGLTGLVRMGRYVMDLFCLSVFFRERADGGGFPFFHSAFLFL